MILPQKKRTQLEYLLARAKGIKLFGVAPDGRNWNEYCSDNLQAALDYDKDPDGDPKELAKKYDRAHRGDIDAQHELQALRIEQTQNYIMPALNYGMFYEIITLQENEAPYILNETMQEFKASYIGQDGGVETSKVVKPQKKVSVDLFELTTEAAQYMTRDLYLGRSIAAPAIASFNLAFDLQNKIDALQAKLLTDNLGAFDLTNANRAARVLNANSRFLAGVIPTTNIITLSGNSGSTLLRPAVFQDIIDYAARFGVDADGMLRPTGEILVPAQDAKEIAAGITFIGQDSVLSKQGAQISDGGWYEIGTFLGVNWRLIPDATIAQKACFARFNRPAGIMWIKPSLDEEIEEVDKVKHLASRVQIKVMALAQPIPWKRNFAKVIYRT